MKYRFSALVVILALLNGCTSSPAKDNESLAAQQLHWRIALLNAQELELKKQLAKINTQGQSSQALVKWSTYQQSREERELALELMDCVELALAAHMLSSAQQCMGALLPFSAQWQADDTGYGRLKVLQLALAERQRVEDWNQRSKARQSAIRMLVVEKAAYQSYVAAGELDEARKVYLNLKQQVPNDEDVLVWGPQLDLIIKDQVNLAIQQGRRLYSQGQLQQALELWREAAKLAPNDKNLRNDILRAESFVDKLDELNE